ncbi:MAG: InlB B-repeat-containing protein, partial [Clostridia bacterium]|nr:InlB B-repeat-containing protein [Clostridia bacterium]
KSAVEKENYLVTFDANYGRVVSGKTSQIVKAGESAVAPVVERNGYRLVGWSCDFSCINQDTNVVAVWEKIEASSGEENNDNSGFEGSEGTSDSSNISSSLVSGCRANIHNNLFGVFVLAVIFLIKRIKKSAA